MSCAPSQPASSAAPAAASETPVRGGRIVEAGAGDPRTMQPVIASDSPSLNVTRNFYLPLLDSSPDDGQLVPGLAERYAQSADGLTLTFTLRDGLVWSDGERFSGLDYKYTVEAVARSKKTAVKSRFQDVVGWADYRDGKTDSLAGVELSADGRVITVRFVQVFCPAIRSLAGAGGGILPQHAFVKVWNDHSTDTSTTIDDNPLNMAPPASMGPFVFKSIQFGLLTMVANDRYWRGRPLVDEYVIKSYANPAAVTAALRVGELSFATVQASDIDTVTKSGNYVVRQFPGTTSTYIGWNAAAAKAPWLRSRDVRQALWYGIDVKSIIKSVLFGYGQPLYTVIAPSSWAYDGTGLNHYDYDPAKAKALLEHAGATMGPDGVYRWTNGQPMQMRIETNQGNPQREAILQIAQEQYKQIGIRIDPMLESFNLLLDRVSPGTDYEGFILGGGGGFGPEPDPYLGFHSSQRGKGQFNTYDFSNAAADRAMEAGRNGPDCSTAARKAQYVTFNQIVNQEAPITFLYAADQTIAFSAHLRGIDPRAGSPTSGWNVERWWVAP